ncbi:MAG: tetratricopeptide repeat protein [Candidatus Eiseniibacteriota bacterium]
MFASLLVGPVCPVRAGAPLLEPLSLADARRGLDHLYHARVDSARIAFERIRARDPHGPAADFLLGGVEWHHVTTGPSGFSAGGDAERSFFARMDRAIELGEKAVRANPRDASARFFTGGAYGYKARYLAIQEKWWEAYRTGRKGLGHLEKAVEIDPDLADAYLGIGIYHYYADVLPSVLKILGAIVGLGGDRERGLAEIRRALDEGELVGVEARFFLAEILTTFEKDQWQALALSRSLREEFPANELFAWIDARVLDELHLTDLSAAEWRALRAAHDTGSLRGFLDYRLARARLYGGDFVGAADQLGRLLRERGLGSPRITMWAAVRYGLCLDFLGRHQEALAQYRFAHDLAASSEARDRAAARLAEGRQDPARISLAELEETAQILKETSGHPEETLLRVERQVTGPSRGLSQAERDRFFDVLADLAEARLRRGDPAGCLAAIARALDSWQEPSKSRRALLEALGARALSRSGRTADAKQALDGAFARAEGDTRARIDRDRQALNRLARRDPAPAPPPGPGTLFRAKDRGEFLLELEADFLPAGRTLPMRLEDGEWRASWPVVDRDSIRYRFVADAHSPRIDPFAPRVALLGDGAWSVAYPKQTNSTPSE